MYAPGLSADMTLFERLAAEKRLQSRYDILRRPSTVAAPTTTTTATRLPTITDGTTTRTFLRPSVNIAPVASAPATNGPVASAPATNGTAPGAPPVLLYPGQPVYAPAPAESIPTRQTQVIAPLPSGGGGMMIAPDEPAAPMQAGFGDLIKSPMALGLLALGVYLTTRKRR